LAAARGSSVLRWSSRKTQFPWGSGLIVIHGWAVVKFPGAAPNADHDAFFTIGA